MMSNNILTADQALNPTRGIEHIVPYPYGSNVRIGPDKELESHLSVMSEMAIQAAILAREQLPEAKITLPGESPFLEEGLTNTTDHMAGIALEAGVPETTLDRMYQLYDGRGLDNTYLQSRGLWEHFDGRSEGMLTLPLRYHSERVQRSLGAFGMTPDFATVESILHEFDVHDYDKYLPIIDGLQESEQTAYRLTNGIGLPKGQLVNLLMRMPVIGGPRIVDVVEGADGELELENTTARKKVAQLTKELDEAAVFAKLLEY